MMGVSLVLCLAVSLATIVVMVMVAFHREYTIKDSKNTVERIMAAISELPDLPPDQRDAKRRAIARDILRDLAFLFELVGECREDDNLEIRERSLGLLREIMQLNWELRKSLFLFYFRPKMVAGCRRILDAAEGHCRAWIAYIYLLKAKYPERYGEISGI